MKERFRKALERRYNDFVKWRFQAIGSPFEEFKKVARSFGFRNEENFRKRVLAACG
ncbi:MAG: hypothetical protein ABIK84_02945 [candidate division WOR-3 bacterium]